MISRTLLHSCYYFATSEGTPEVLGAKERAYAWLYPLERIQAIIPFAFR